MYSMAINEQFEEASFYRDELSFLTNNYYFNSTNSKDLINTDIIGSYVLDKKIQIVILFFRGGYIIDKASLYSEAKSIDIKHDIGQLICQFYSKKTSIPKRIILSDDFPYAENLKKELEGVGS